MSLPAAVEFIDVDIVFGDAPGKALPMIDAGERRETILERTGQVLGAAQCNLAVARGELFVLMGLSGSGKSTLLRAVNRLNRVTRGKVLIEDGGQSVDVANCGQRILRRLRTRRIAMVFQQFALFPWRTVAENVGFGLELRGTSAVERARTVREKLELVHLGEWADKYAHELSGGMQQRVGLARAFATDADILLMDEPFSALDPLIRDRLQDELLELQQQLGKTIIFVSHDLDEAIKLGNRIAIMEGGRIVQAGTPEEIISAPANDYVQKFVANVNPLGVFRARSLMRPVGAEDLPGRASAIAALTADRTASPTAVTCSPETAMRELIACAARGHGPFIVVDDDGTVLGVVDRQRLFSALIDR
ncbi:MAG: choline ABC transporter ATP-binding protein [Geminicoccaceae bacterium]